MKTCNTCGQVKAPELFPKSGLKCKVCAAEYLRAYRIENKETLNAKQRDKYHARDEQEREAERARGRKRHTDDREAQLARGKNYYERNKAKVLARCHDYGQKNREAMTTRVRNWRRANPEKALSAIRAYYSRMRKTAPWANKERIAAIYRESKAIRALGVDCHVDHIIPLRGKTVSGLHTDANLRIILAEENMRKNAKFTEELL